MASLRDVIPDEFDLIARHAPLLQHQEGVCHEDQSIQQEKRGTDTPSHYTLVVGSVVQYKKHVKNR